MLTRFKIWLFKRFFPAYIHETMAERITALERENSRLSAYAAGLKTALRMQHTIQLCNKKEVG